MQYFSSKKFDQQFARLSKKTKNQCTEKFKIFLDNPFDPILNNHSVHHPYEGCRSINISGDVRALYEVHNDVALFIRIGSHSQLYK